MAYRKINKWEIKLVNYCSLPNTGKNCSLRDDFYEKAMIKEFIDFDHKHDCKASFASGVETVLSLSIEKIIELKQQMNTEK